MSYRYFTLNYKMLSKYIVTKYIISYYLHIVFLLQIYTIVKLNYLTRSVVSCLRHILFLFNTYIQLLNLETILTNYHMWLVLVMRKSHFFTTWDFTKSFIVECDASINWIISLLMGDGWPLVSKSWPIKRKNLQKSI